MANTVYTVEYVDLQDENTVTLKPLVVNRLRHFMKMIGEMGITDDPEVVENIMLNSAAFCISKENPQYWDAKKKNGSYPDPDWAPGDDDEEGAEAPQVEFLKGGYTEDFGEAADMPTVVKIIQVCGGIDFNNPNLLRAAAEAEAATGTTT